MDLVEFFGNRFRESEDRYYANFFKGEFISHFGKLRYSVVDEDDLIQKWKENLYPKNSWSIEGDMEFALSSYWLYKNGFSVEGHPNILEVFRGRQVTSDGELYSATKRKFGTNQSGAVTWSDRRLYIDELKIERADRSAVALEQSLEKIMARVSPRNAEFVKMELNEKLANIRDVFEHIGKQNGKYVSVPYDTLSNGKITPQAVRSFADELQCFRHGESDMVKKRDEYSEEHKKFLVDYGLTVLMLAYRFLQTK